MARGAHGLFHGDWRYVRSLELLVDGEPVEHIATDEEPGGTVFHGFARDTAADGSTPRVLVERMREVWPGGMLERVTVVNGHDVPVTVLVQLRCRLELAPMWTVRAGAPAPVALQLVQQGEDAEATDGVRTLRARVRGGELELDGDVVTVSHTATVAPGDWAGFALELELDDPTLAVRGIEHSIGLDGLLPIGRPVLERWTDRAAVDLDNLLLDAGHGVFPAAGAPWHLTLMARDALITSRLLLPVDTDVAEGTLRTLAAWQGMQHDPETGEEFGRIVHELRQEGIALPAEGIELPPVHFGSIDSTPLWIVLLHGAWRAGLRVQAVRELRPVLHAALHWLEEGTGDDFLRYPERSGTGLAHQGWRDSAGAIRFHDGEEAHGAIALAQVQALACRAAECAADLLDALGDGGERWRAWAERLRERFRAQFWIHRGEDRFPALALDGDGRPVDSLTSDIGQLIGTTLLSCDEERRVADLLLDERLSSGFGLRSMATDAAAYWPMSQHCGAIWPHDTAIAIEGLLRVGLVDHARRLAEQLERAADGFAGRLPARFAGSGLGEVAVPTPCPDACCPEAWSAASVMPVRMAFVAAEGVVTPGGAPHLVALTPPEHDDEPIARRVVGERAQGSAPTLPARGRARLHLVEPDERAER